MTKRVKFFLIAFFVSLPFWWGINIFQENLEKFFYAQISEPFQNISEIKIPPKPQKPKLDLEAKSAISVKVKEAGKDYNPPTTSSHPDLSGWAPIIAFEKNSEETLPIASLTKLMTAVIVLEDKNYDLEETWTISKTAANQENVPNYGNLKEEEKFNVNQLLDLMLIYSSNDAAFALSEFFGVENFVAKMNQKAEELGLKNTHFVNPTGLDPEKILFNQETSIFFNSSTAKDLVKLAQYIFKNYPLIFEISLKKGPYPLNNGVSSLVLPENQTPERSEGREMNEVQRTILGGKTGYTDEAGGCILFVFRDEEGNTFFNVILGTESQTARITEMQKLIDWLSL